MNPLRWGILGASRFAQQKIIPAMRQCRYAVAAAIASRDLQKAQQAASQCGIPTAYGTYEQLLADPSIDVVYIPLANHLHVPWSIRALMAGKHVLCEKPIALTAAEAQQLLDVSERHPQLKIMEAFMYRFHPQWQRARQIVEGGGIGELRSIQSVFSFFNNDAGNIRNRSEVGGGALLDIGCYCVSLSRYVFASEPRRVFAVLEYDPKFNTDRLGSGILQFERGISSFTFSTQLAPFQRVQIIGAIGRVEIEIPFNAPADLPCKIRHQRDSRFEEFEHIDIEVCNQYTLEIDAFSLAVLTDAPVPTPLADAVANLRVMDAIVESNRRGAWVGN